MVEVEVIREIRSRAELVKYLGYCSGYRIADVPYESGQHWRHYSWRHYRAPGKNIIAQMGLWLPGME